jgi:PAS domain S-box-containing protein
MTPGPDLADHTACILIVDDERPNRELLEIMLKAEGFALQTASGGEDALAIIARDRPDLVLLDIMMPGMDGYEVVRRIKGNPATKNIPVIVVTALDDRDARMLALSAGAEDFLTKPIDRAELCMRVRNLLRLKAYGDYHDKYRQILEGEVTLRTADLRLERDRAQRYLDTAEVILLALDLDARITLVNRYACAILGRTADELRGCDWIETCLPLRARAAFRRNFHALLAEDLNIVEHLVVTRQGEERLIEWRNIVLRDDAGRVTGTFSSGTDITERTRAVEALRMTEERMRFALEAAGVGIWDVDYTTGIVQWSEILESQYGLHPGTFGGTHEAVLERIHPDDQDRVRQTLETAAASGVDFSIQNRSLWPDGTVRWLSGAGRVRLGANGEPIRGVGISQDVTDQQTLETQVRQTSKMEAIGQLASGVAHDFNNLLTVILGLAELVKADGDITAQHSEDLSEIVKAAQRAAGLTRQLLVFGRQQVLDAVPLDVNALITEMTSMLRRLIGEHIKVSLALAPQLSLALTDRGQLEQVVMNLVVNARDAMPGGGSLSIETADVELENSPFHKEAVTHGQYVMLAVSDTGSGMTKETQRRLFEPFFTTKEIGQGTGLGLSTAYGIVKQSNGYIWVYSELGLGTTFKVYLPRSDGGVFVPAVPRVVTSPVERGLETVLLVEDEPGVRLLSRRILDHAGYRVLEAIDGHDAEQVFARHAESIDLLVTDMIMPGCGGPELLKRLQVHAPALKVLYMSGYTEQSAAHQAGSDRDRPFLQKPFTAAMFLRHVRDALDGCRR